MTTSSPDSHPTPVYDPKRTALLVVDPYNDFMTEGGKLYEATKESADSVGFYENMPKLLAAVRAAGIQIIVVPHHQAHKDDFDGWANINALQQTGKDIMAFEAGSWGAEWHPVFGPRPGDVIVREHFAQNGFANTDLELQLNERGIERLILVGFIANSCVEATGRYGMELGYNITLVKDATGAFDLDGMLAATINGPMYAHHILTTDELTSSLVAQ
jgi:nicotinamidase-related amidase